MDQVHSSPTPARTVDDGKSVNIKIIKAEGARRPNMIARYKKKLAELNLPKYHSREMRKQFFEHFGLVVNAKPSVLAEMYQFLTNDCSQSTIDNHVSQKLKFMFDS